MGAVLLALIALFTHSVARDFLARGMRRNAARLEQMQKEHSAYIPDLQATLAIKNYNLLTTVGIVLTALSLVCMIAALIRHEPGWYLILILLLLFDVLAPLFLAAS